MAAGERASLARALAAVRCRRGLRRRDVAKAMGMSLRTYENFESGRGPASYDRLAAFADATDCDLAALLLAHHLGGPKIALESMGNKALSIAIGAVQDIAARGERSLGDVSSASLVAAFELACASALASAQAGLESPPSLSPREVECLRWVQAGKSSYAIGAILGISPRTVDGYLLSVCRRLGVTYRVQAVSQAIKLGLLSP